MVNQVLFKRKINRLLLFLFILIFSFGCTSSQPPLEFAPNGEIIKKAVILNLEKSHNNLSRQLNTETSEIKINKIDVIQIKPNLIFNLPTYHLEGKYQIIVKKTSFQKRIINNTFNIDLQRKSKGDTWRILIKTQENKSEKYFSYLIR